MGSAYSTKAELLPLALGTLQGWPSGLGCWDGWRHGWSAWAVASSGASAGRRCHAVIFFPLPLFSPVPLSPSLQIVGVVPWCRRWGCLKCWAGWWFPGGAGSLWFLAGLASSAGLCPLRLCWVLALPCVLWRWLFSGSAVLCWALTVWGCWLWLSLGFPGSWLCLGAGLAGVQAVPVCVVAGLGDRRAVVVAQAHSVRHIAQIKPCSFGYYSRENR